MPKKITTGERFKQIGQRFKMCRKLLDLKKEETAQHIGLQESDIENIEKGDIIISLIIAITGIMVDQYGFNPRRILYGTGFVFLKRGPLISNRFYETHRILFQYKAKPWVENLMQLTGSVPEIDQIMEHKLRELKLYFRDRIQADKLDNTNEPGTAA